MENLCNCTNLVGLGKLCGSAELWLMLAIVCALLTLCGGWMLLCFIVSHCTDGRSKFIPRFRRSLSLKLKDMEHNPIYGNITYTQTPGVDLPPSSSAANEHQPSKQKAHSGQQDCYANLKLKAPKPPSARSSPKIQYSDVMTLPRAEEISETAVDTDVVSLRSDLYASVDTERSKTVGSDKDYANHI